MDCSGSLHMTWAAVLADGSLNSVSPSPVVTWELPAPAKYRFPVRGLEPFIALGPSFRLRQSLTSVSPYGIAAGAGVDIHMRRLQIAPAIPYTHWGQEKAPAFGAAVRNQIEFLVGFSF